MPTEERDRSALLRAAADSWGEEVAATLSELLPPSGARPATRTDIDGVLTAMDAMDGRLEGRMDGLEGRMDGLEGRMDRLEGRMDGVEERLGGVEREVRGLRERIDGIVDRVNADAERRFTDLVTAQTRSLMLSLFGTVVVIAALAFGLR
jgi:predicted nuclease with TOPRIM domain